MAKKKRKPVPEKSKRLLQKEINSNCPMCENQEVDHFEIHHIDEDPSNNDLNNLLMLCRICHSKITKGDVSEKRVRAVKLSLKNAKQKIELVSVFIDEDVCAWETDEINEQAFYSINNKNLNSSLILTWSFINHTNKTIILRQLKYKAQSLPSGISGISSPSILIPIAQYKIPIVQDNKEHKKKLIPQIQIPAKQAFQFQTELFTVEYKFFIKQKYLLDNRCFIDFEFGFSDKQSVKTPRVYINCKSENRKMIIGYIK